MNDEVREQIALARYKIISPVLAEPGRVRNEYFREQARRVHDFPHIGRRHYTISAFKNWLGLYRRRGFAGLKPRPRADRGAPRRITAETLDIIRVKAKAFPHRTVRMLYEELLAEGHLGEQPACYNTLLRTLKREDLLPRPGRKDVRKRYEVPEVNELWVADFMHGPQVRVGRFLRKAILCAIIDDHSRVIVGNAFAAHETISALTTVLKQALETYGIPRRLYVDNGPAFCSDLLTKACAEARISLIHSKPYDSPSRGKVERFFRTVRERFLCGVVGELTLEDLDEAFSAWLADQYHRKVHTGIGARPLDRYHASVGRVEIRHLSSRELDEIFLVRHERVVNNDATISFKGGIYEVPGAYIRQRIEIRHPIDDPEDLALYDNGIRVAKLKLVNVRENARTFRPASSRETLSFAREKVRS